MNKKIVEKLFPGTLKQIVEKKCPLCKCDITEFRDYLSLKEYENSGICQNCQDNIFY